jgi:hypothetical protein
MEAGLVVCTHNQLNGDVPLSDLLGTCHEVQPLCGYP